MKRSLGAKPLACPSPVWCVGTYDRDGRPNVMTASWAGICCSKPPAVAVSLRKATYTYQSIVDNKAFTVSIPSREQVVEADYIGIASGKDSDKFQGAGLSPAKAEHVNAPYVAEFPLAIECRLIHTLAIGLHTLFVGEIVDVKADESLFDEEGKIDMTQVDPFVFSAPNRTYHALGEFIGKAFSIGRDLKKNPAGDAPGGD